LGESKEGRLGNVAGVVIAGDATGASVQRAAELLARICAHVAIVDDPRLTRLAAVVSGLQAVDAERALVVEAAADGPSAPLVLALTAWPESPAVVPELDSPGCAIYVRDAVLPRALARLRSAADDEDLSSWLSECGASVLDAATLAAISEADR